MSKPTYNFTAGDKLYAKDVNSIDPDNPVAQSPAKLIGGDDVVLANFQALGLGDNDGAFKINIDGVEYDNVGLAYSYEIGEEIDNLEHDTANGTYNSLVKIDDTHFILAYSGSGDDGYIKTFSIDESYNITQIKSLEHNTTQGMHNSLVKIDDTHFMLAYTLNDWGCIKTFSIDESYNITQIDSLEHESYGLFTSLIQIDDTHFMLAYRGYGSDGCIKIFSIDESYNITQINSLIHDTSNGTYNSLVKIDDTHFMLAYAGDGDDGYIKTFSIDASYNITEIDSLEHDTSNGTYNSLVKIDDTHFILAYTGGNSYGYIKTFSIDESYNITQIASLEHNTYGLYNSLVQIDDTNFMLAYTGDGDDGYIKIFSIDSSYNITEIDNLEHDTANGTYNSLVKIDDTHFILAYSGKDSDGYIKTFTINFDISSEDAIATAVQTAIRARTGKLETVVWNTDHFEITSSTSGKNNGSQVLKLQPPTTGTDISGAGYLDLGENAIEVAGDGDDYKLVRLDEDGQIPLEVFGKIKNKLSSQIGENQVTTGRELNTVYQNTTNRTRIVLVSTKNDSYYGSSDSFAYIGTTNPPSTLVGKYSTLGNEYGIGQLFMIVPPNYYYTITATYESSGSGSYTPVLVSWFECDLI